MIFFVLLVMIAGGIGLGYFFTRVLMAPSKEEKKEMNAVDQDTATEKCGPFPQGKTGYGGTGLVYKLFGWDGILEVYPDKCIHYPVGRPNKTFRYVRLYEATIVNGSYEAYIKFDDGRDSDSGKREWAQYNCFTIMYDGNPDSAAKKNSLIKLPEVAEYINGRIQASRTQMPY